MMRKTGLVLLALALAVGGCKHAPAPKPSASVDQAEQARKFAQCMRDEGVEVQEVPAQDGPGGTGLTIGSSAGPESKKLDAAMEKCRQYLPNGGEPTKLDPEQLEAMRKFAKCMRENGLPDFPDPDPDGGGFSVKSGDDEDKFKAAMEKCRQLMPEGPGGHRAP
jgi:hypothetical protein